MKKEYKQLLHDAGLKATKMRGDVLGLFDVGKKPLSVAQIKKNLQSADVATLYRIVEIFVDKGILCSVHVCGPRHFFELAALPHHHHIVCTKCGIIEDVSDCNLTKVIKNAEIASTKFNKITEHTFELFGLCKKCQ